MAYLTKAAVLLLTIAVCVLGFLVTKKLREQTPSPAPRDLFAIVNQQLTAVRSADFESAYHFAAAGVQQRFTRSEFEKMVRAEYPEMMRGSRVEYGEATIAGQSASVQVYVFGASDSVRVFVYHLAREADAWKVDTVEEVKAYRAAHRLAGTHA